jgi:hypothetical protein
MQATIEQVQQVQQVQQTLKEIFALLEEHEPIWYTRGHQKRLLQAQANIEAVQREGNADVLKRD